MLKNLINRHKFLLLSLTFVMFAFSLAQRRADKNIDKSINLKKYEQTLHIKEQFCNTIADSIIRLIDKNEIFDSIFQDKLFDIQQVEQITNLGYSFFIYKNDTISFWSDNIIEISNIFNPNDILGQCNFVSNHWILSTLKQFDNYKIVVLFRIKSEFPRKNKFLEEKFHKDLKIPNNYKISLIPLSYGIDIKNSNNEYIFSIIPQSHFVENKSVRTLSFIAFILSLIFFLLYLNTLLKNNLGKKINYFNLIFLIVVTIIFRYLQIIYQFPKQLYETNYFDILIFSNSKYFSTLGDFFINVLLVSWIFYVINQLIIRLFKNFSKIKPIIIYLLSTTEFFIVFCVVELIRKTIINSSININLNNFSQINQEQILLLAILIFVVFVASYIFYSFITIIYQKKTPNNNISVVFGLSSALILIYLIFGEIQFKSILLIVLATTVYIAYLYKNKTHKLYLLGSILIIINLLTTNLITGSVKQKQDLFFSVLAQNLTSQSDPITENLLQNIVPKLEQDQTLFTYAQNPSLSNIEKETEKYLRRRYFKDYFNKYDIEVDICSDKLDSVNKNLIYCNSLYSNRLTNATTIIANKLYLVTLPNTISQYLIIQSFEENGKIISNFYITLYPKLYPTNLGYPELLLDEHTLNNNLTDISYAKYENNKLIYRYGKFNYPFENTLFSFDKNSTKKDKNTIHYIYKINNNSIIVITYNSINWLTKTVVFSYLFVIFTIIVLIFFVVKNFQKVKDFNQWSFRIKLTISLVAVVTVFLALLGITNIYFNVNQYNKKFVNDAYTKIEQINTYIQQYSIYDNILSLPADTLNYKLRQLAEIFSNDINIYNQKGWLIGTSRPEVFSLNLISTKISYKALRKIQKEKISQFIINEHISNLDYLSAYLFFQLPNLQKSIIINLPYFTRPDEVQKEVFRLITSIINIYVVLLTLIIIFGVLISEQIISPLKVLQNKFKKLDISKGYEKIEYNRKDEIGQLVEEYNKMVDKIQEYIEKLAKSERESAWRDMAKQIAHEIKNPLTPMKLSIQLLMRSWENQDTDFDVRISEVSRTLISQIETLRRIAEEFSEFAKMPKPQETIFNMVEKIEEICKLFENVENIDVYANLRDFQTVIVYADDKQITRALINLIKNAIQAIPEGIRGKVIIDIDVFGEKIFIKIIDNGSGIPEDIKDKLFVPSFTTKSSGMGLGLAMVKNIIDNAHGKISFKSEQGKGTTFVVELPLYKEDLKS